MNWRDYWSKMLGTRQASPPPVSRGEILWSGLGGFVGMAAIAWVETLWLADQDLHLMIGSFGASAGLVFGAIRSPLAQPRNLIGGHFLSALVGVAAYQLAQPLPWLAASLAVAGAISVMHATRTLHPPGGATALIAVIGSEHIHRLGWWYPLMPVTLGVLILLLVALLLNNLAPDRRYPEIWW